MSEQLLKSTLKGKKIKLKVSEDTDLLHKGGFGDLDKNSKQLILGPVEALYLLSEKRIIVVEDKKEHELTFTDIIQHFRKDDAVIWTRYLIYRDLRSRGYVVRDGFGFGVDFRLYERGKYGEQAAKYMVFGMCEGVPISIKRLNKILRFVQSTKKELILAVVDRRGEIVYYSLSPLVF
jgi:tRNA-intron endonuclease